MPRNFLLTPDDSDPLEMLWSAFPELRKFADLGVAFQKLAQYLDTNLEDGKMWGRVYAFFESLAAAGELARIRQLLIIEILCDYPIIYQRLESNLTPDALRALNGA
jgi:hypothetical protein